eukprot:SAG31_NODE_44744_length_261_cov_0.962963_1_plen_43_part_01
MQDDTFTVGTERILKHRTSDSVALGITAPARRQLSELVEMGSL